MKKIFLILIIFISNFSISGQTRSDLNINYMVRGFIYASSAIDDTLSPGGFGGSDNNPKRVYSSGLFLEKGFFLKIDTTKQITFAKKFNGYNLYIVNKTDSTIMLQASDSRLDVVAEAFVKNKWQTIEYLPSSGCGNSYHNVYLEPNQYWEFSVPKYNGKIKTKIRYRLEGENGAYLYSNETSGSINKGQLKHRQGHKPSGLMDPYNE